ncbi:MAG: sigma-54-dependent transcriptional regulator, partial [Spirochaetota bacterium]
MSILVVDDEQNMCTVLRILLENDGHTVHTAYTGSKALDILCASRDVGLVISDLRLPDFDGIEMLKRMKGMGLDIPMVLITAYGSIEVAVQAMKMGARDFITKPFNKEVIRHIVRKVLREVDAQAAPGASRDMGPAGELTYRSRAMAEIMATVKKVSGVQTPVLIVGESGVGKELIARAIHRAGGLPSPEDRPFISISCPAVPEHLLESELFGYQKGAFTGAVRDYRGKLQLAHGGTLLLDEIGDLPLPIQPKLLRFLEEKSFRQLGSLSTITVSTRILCATNRNLKDMVASGKFREDLFYRINTVTIEVPPLRERREDIIPLAEHFLDVYAKKIGKGVRRLSPGLRRAFQDYSWPGNVRELRNVIERAVVLTGCEEIGLSDVPAEFQELGLSSLSIRRPAGNGREPAAASYPGSGTGAYSRSTNVLEDSEKSLLLKTLQEQD